MCQSLEDIMDSLASKVVLKDALDKSNTCFKFAKVNFKYPSVQKHSENGDVGVAAKPWDTGTCK